MKYLFGAISKVLIIIMTLCMFVLPAKTDGLKIETDPVTTDSKSISFVCTNHTNRITNHRPAVINFEKSVDGKWVNMPFEAVLIEQDAGFIWANEKINCSFSFSRLGCETLEKGEYRITISYNVITGVKETMKGYSTATFTVTEAE